MIFSENPGVPDHSDPQASDVYIDCTYPSTCTWFVRTNSFFPPEQFTEDNELHLSQHAQPVRCQLTLKTV